MHCAFDKWDKDAEMCSDLLKTISKQSTSRVWAVTGGTVHRLAAATVTVCVAVGHDATITRPCRYGRTVLVWNMEWELICNKRRFTKAEMYSKIRLKGTQSEFFFHFSIYFKCKTYTIAW